MKEKFNEKVDLINERIKNVNKEKEMIEQQLSKQKLLFENKIK